MAHAGYTLQGLEGMLGSAEGVGSAKLSLGVDQAGWRRCKRVLLDQYKIYVVVPVRRRRAHALRARPA